MRRREGVKGRVCILLHGVPPRRAKRSCEASAFRVRQYTLPLMEAMVTDANAASFAFDVVGHSWAPSSWSNGTGCRRDEAFGERLDLESVLLNYAFRHVDAVAFASTPSRPARRATAAFESLAAALRVALRAPRYDWILAMRWDVVFYARFDLPALDPSLFYVAHHCHPKLREWANESANVYRYGDWRSMDTCAPDFWYASNPTHMAIVFLHMGEDATRVVFNATDCDAGHGLLGGRLRYLLKRKELAVGRYKYHLRDFHYVRDDYFFFDKNGSFEQRLECALSGKARWTPYDPNTRRWNDPKRPASYSRCPPPDVHYLDCLA